MHNAFRLYKIWTGIRNLATNPIMLIMSLTTLWFFKRLKSHPGYLMCSDRTVYSKRLGTKLATHPNRQGVPRAQLVDKPNRKRIMRSLEYLFRVNFLRPLPQTVQSEIDVPF